MKRISAAWILAGLFAAAGCHKGEKAASAPPQADSAAAPPAAAAPAPTAAPPSKGGVMVTDKALLDGHLVEVIHSKWDGGQTSDMFDTNKDSLARTENANPAIIEIKLPEPRPLKGVTLTTGGMDAGLTVTVQPASGAAKTYNKEFRHMPADPTFGLDFDTGSAPVSDVRIEIKDLNGGDGHIHIRTLKLR